MKNLITFDLETTGLDRSKHFIIQIAAIKTNPKGEIIDTLNEYIQPSGSYSIDLGAYFKHHITPEFLKDKPYFKDIAPKIIEFFSPDCAILTYNGLSFDIAFLSSELERAGYELDFTKFDCYDAFLEEKRRHPNTLEGTYKRYNEGISMEDSGLSAHDALSDVKATYYIFLKQQEENGYGPEKMFGEDNVLSIMDFNGNNEVCFNFGKYKGVSLTYVAKYDQGYLKWCVSDKSNFGKHTKEYIKNYINE